MYRQISQTFLSRKYLDFWGNLVQNFDGQCDRCDFFSTVISSFGQEQATELLLDAFNEKEIQKMREEQLMSGRIESAELLKDLFLIVWNGQRNRDRVRMVLESIRAYLKCMYSTGQDDMVEKKFKELKRVLHLTELEGEIATLAYVCRETAFNWPCQFGANERPLYFAMALNRSYDEVCQALTAKGRLRRIGVVDRELRFNRRAFGGFLNGCEQDPLERRFYRPCNLEDSLPWGFFGELAESEGVLLRRILSAKDRCNVLLYGVPGTGKSSFARTLAKEVGLRAFDVVTKDEEGLMIQDRSVSVQVANEQLDSKDALLIVDEADTFLRGDARGFVFGANHGGIEKGELNMLLDDMRIPAIWISNVPADEMDESVRRRFDYSVCFERMNTAQRINVWRNLVKKFGLSSLISDDKIADYASRYETSAGGISTVLTNLKRIAAAQEEVDELVAKLMKPHCKLMGVKDGNHFLPVRGYSLEGLNIKGKVKLDRVVEAVCNYLDADFNVASEDKPRMNVLLFGPPGTGKTEFVKYLGKTLDRKVLVVKGSDLLSKWVGESEQNIASAFRQAEAEGAILFFDEVDGLVQSRDNAHASWEVTQVNELLQQMENFDGVMVAATNFCKNLDPAIMRRFTFKLEFDYLDDDGKRVFFEKLFKSALSGEELAELKEITNLTPGDFRTVRQEQFYMDETLDNIDRIAALREECALKHDGKRRAKIGFAA